MTFFIYLSVLNACSLSTFRPCPEACHPPPLSGPLLTLPSSTFRSTPPACLSLLHGPLRELGPTLSGPLLYIWKIYYFRYSVQAFWFYYSQTFIWLSNISILSVSDEGYSIKESIVRTKFDIYVFIYKIVRRTDKMKVISVRKKLKGQQISISDELVKYNFDLKKKHFRITSRLPNLGLIMGKYLPKIKIA